ncbi:MFS transporter [Actinoplanes aureus]|uniref:MFS transporter n=2 Tax=Actinoplanes aureus TaxID=2792083 RepID=A0A931G3V2_9ACTN|nr:MFS transporter [Actinoplanes aureus]MBG0569277.1 MFS transporter [Actinoplanes aureus]
MGYLKLLRRRPVLVLWSSAAMSVLGDRLYGLAVMWVVYASTGSAAWMGVAAVVESIPYIVIGTFGRDLVARFASFGALGWLDAGRAAAACAVPLLWSPDGGGLAVLLVLVFVLGTLGALFDPNLGGLVPDLVEPGEVRQVTALLDLTTRIAAIAGPGAVGLILLTVTEVQLFALDGVTFVVSAAAMWWLHSHARRTVRSATSVPAPGGNSAPGTTGSAVAAVPVLRRHPDVAVGIGLHGVGFFVAAVSAVGLPALLAVKLGQGAAGYGLALAAVGAGALAGNLLVGNVRLGRWLSVYCGAWTVAGLALLGYSAAPSLPILLAVGFLAGLATPAAAVTLRTRLAEFGKPQRLRLITVDQTVIRTAGTLGMLTLPLAVDAAPATAFAGAGVLLIAAAGVAALAGRRVTAAAVALPAGEPVASRAS